MAKRVRNEVSLHRRLSHPNILSLQHYFEDDDRVYLVMELCSRGEVYSLLKRRREAGEEACLSEGEARAVLRDVVAGLRFLHSRGIIHRDLKLSNILLAEDGQAKIADFGLAVSASTSNSTDDCERTICGTPNYLAPEIVGKRRYGRAADIWSLGCLLYSFLTGRPPFDSPDLPSTFERVRNLDYHVPGHISAPARDLITRLLCPNPSDRPTFDQIIFHPFFNPAVIAPLQTRRLAPLRQSTKYGTVEIKDDGSVQVDFMEAPEIVSISPDGMFIRIMKKGNLSNQLTFTLAKLPDQFKKRYEYARRFVNLVRSKTPLIVLSTPRFKAYLMENGCNGINSSGDFHLHYRQEPPLKLDYCWVSRQLRFTTEAAAVAKCVLNDPSLQVLSHVEDPRMREGLLEFLARYRQCLQVRDAILHPDGQERGALKSQFPFVIREGFDAEGNVLGSTGSTLGNSGNLSGNHLANASHLNAFHLANTSQLAAFANTSLNNSSINASIHASLPMKYPHSQSQPQLPTINESVASPLPALNRKHLPGVGWCLNSSDDQFLVLFDDGVSLAVDGGRDCVNDGWREWKIDAHLPEHLKQRLSMFSQFL